MPSNTSPGLLALAGTADMRKAQARAAAGDETATLAFDVFIHRLVTGIGAMTAAAGGLDALVFPGGIGEHSPAVRAAAVATHRLGHLGVRIDAGHNDEAEHDADISHKQASVRTLVVTAREDLQIAGRPQCARRRRLGRLLGFDVWNPIQIRRQTRVASRALPCHCSPACRDQAGQRQWRSR